MQDSKILSLIGSMFLKTKCHPSNDERHFHFIRRIILHFSSIHIHAAAIAAVSISVFFKIVDSVT